MAVLLGVGIGLVAAVVAWIFTRSLFAPRLAWSQGISRQNSDSEESASTYRIKLRNFGWLRSILELRLRAVVIIPVPQPVAVIRIPLQISIERIDYVYPGEVRVGSLDATQLSNRSLQLLESAGFIGLARNHRRTLDDLLRAHTKAFLIVTALGLDGWSGAQHLRLSPHYTSADVVSLPFIGKEARSDEGVLRRFQRWLVARRKRTRTARHNRRVNRFKNLQFSDIGPLDQPSRTD
jgi:hypothetical protein